MKHHENHHVWILARAIATPDIERILWRSDVPAEKVVAVGRLNRPHRVKEPSLSHFNTYSMIFQQSGLHSGHIHPAILTFTLSGYQGFDLIVSSALKHVWVLPALVTGPWIQYTWRAGLCGLLKWFWLSWHQKRAKSSQPSGLKKLWRYGFSSHDGQGIRLTWTKKMSCKNCGTLGLELM